MLPKWEITFLKSKLVVYTVRFKIANGRPKTVGYTRKKFKNQKIKKKYLLKCCLNEYILHVFGTEYHANINQFSFNNILHASLISILLVFII